METFDAGYALGWCGVAERLLNAPTPLWLSMWGIGVVICLYVVVPAYMRYIVDTWRMHRDMLS